MIVDYDKISRLKNHRVAVFLVGCVVLCTLVANLSGLEWIADVFLTVQAVYLFVRFVNYTVDIYRLSLVDDDRLHKPRRETPP